MSGLLYADIIGDLKGAFYGVSDFMYSGSRPNATDERNDEFVVLSVPSGFVDLRAYHSFDIRISIFCRDIDNVENYTLLSKKQGFIEGLLPFNGDRFSIFSPRFLPVGSDRLGFHFMHVMCKMVYF